MLEALAFHLWKQCGKHPHLDLIFEPQVNKCLKKCLLPINYILLCIIAFVYGNQSISNPYEKRNYTDFDTDALFSTSQCEPI